MRIVFVFVFSFFVCDAIAQPTLPDIAGTADKGIALLSWNCQYSGIKAISVLRSSDSTANYANIGYVKKLAKGIQAYVDGHPAPGENYYKLSIVFKTGLTWSSNHVAVYIDTSLLESSKVFLPSNDSLQHFIVTEYATKTQIPATEPTNTGITAPEKNNVSKTTTKNYLPTETKPRISISFDVSDTTQLYLETQKNTIKPPVQHKAITISFDAPESNPAYFVKSRFIATNALTGHVEMTLPDDIARRHYSVKFYDLKDHIVLEVPRIKAPKIIIDKRNFQHKGLYKFILRKDFTELESGYITIF